MVFVGEPTESDLAAVADEARAAARDSGAIEAVRDGVSIARLVDVGDLDGAAVIADQYLLTLDDLAAQLGPTIASVNDGVTRLLAAGYRLANLCNAGDHPTAHALAESHGTTVAAILATFDA